VHEGCLTKRRSLWRFERLSRRKVRRLAYNCLLLSRTHTDQIADYDQAGGNAYTGLQWSTGLQTPNRLDQLQPCPHRSLGVILVGLGHPMVYCEKCLHHAPMALVPLMIRWGADTSSDRLRQSARCTKCGHRGATLQHPGWAGTHIGFQPFPLPASDS
jgi:hypothetical protein